MGSIVKAKYEAGPDKAAAGAVEKKIVEDLKKRING